MPLFYLPFLVKVLHAELDSNQYKLLWRQPCYRYTIHAFAGLRPATDLLILSPGSRIAPRSASGTGNIDYLLNGGTNFLRAPQQLTIAARIIH